MAPPRRNSGKLHGLVKPSSHKSISSLLCFCSLVLYGVLLLLFVNMQLMRKSMDFYTLATDRFLGTTHDTHGPIQLDESPHRTKVLGPGDLPGYTGWARPALTLAGWFQIQEAPLRTSAGSSWKATVACRHDLCRSGGALFDVRAYGPAVMTGTVTDHHDGTYELSMFFFDEGSYTVEWVLAFSKPPSFDKFPWNVDIHYEGYLLPGFPLTLEVSTASTVPWYQLPSVSRFRSMGNTPSEERNSSASPNEVIESDDHDVTRSDDTTAGQQPMCTMSEIFQSDYTGILQKGRWLVEDRVTDPIRTASIQSSAPIAWEKRGNNSSITDAADELLRNPFAQVNVSHKEYESGLNSIGFRMDFHRPSCYLPTLEEIRPRLSNRNRHFILIGDSNMDRQNRLLTGMNYSSTVIDVLTVFGGLQVTLLDIRSKLQKLAVQARKERDTTDYYILFNTGLHEIGRMCIVVTMRTFLRQINSTVPIEELGPCTERYRYYLTELILSVQAFPAKLAVFQTTVAGWAKWGNYGFGWSPTSGQTLPKANQVVEHFNRIAWNLMQEHKVPTVDAYWRSVARPDHREVTAANDIGAHLVHMGPELYDLYMREWMLLVAEREQELSKSETGAGAR